MKYLLILLLALIGCSTYTPALELTYKAKCVGYRNDTALFEHYYDCKKPKLCAIQMEAVGKYEVGKFYWVKYRK